MNPVTEKTISMNLDCYPNYLLSVNEPLLVVSGFVGSSSTNMKLKHSCDDILITSVCGVDR